MSNALTEADVAAVREVWDTMEAATFATDWDTYEQHLTQDIVFLDPRIAGPLRGRAAWREWVDTVDFSDVEGAFTVEEVSGGGDLAYMVLTFDASWVEDGEKIEAKGKGLSLLRREDDGSWRMSHNAWNANP